jgi:hypothetical protein
MTSGMLFYDEGWAKRDESGDKGKKMGKAAPIRVVRRYKNILDCHFIGPSEILVHEWPWIRVLEELPDALGRQRYGT